MADQHDGTLLLFNRAFCGGYVIGKRAQWILHGNDVQAPCLEQRNDLVPALSVREGTVHEHDVRSFQIVYRCSVDHRHGCEAAKQERRCHQFFEQVTHDRFSPWVK